MDKKTQFHNLTTSDQISQIVKTSNPEMNKCDIVTFAEQDT